VRTLSIIVACLVASVGLFGRVQAGAADQDIVFEAGNGDLYVVGADGTAFARLTDTPRDERMPAWSTAHDRIAFGAGHGVYLMDADGTNVQQILNLRSGTFITGLTWSPNDDRLAIQGSRLVSHTGGFVRYCSSLWTAAPDGSTLQRLQKRQNLGGGLTWSPSGKWLAVSWDSLINSTNSCTRRSSNGIFRMRPNGSQVQSLHAVYGSYPDWSPNGRRIAFQDWRDTCHACSQVWVMSPSGRHQHRILGHGFIAEFYEPRWSPTGGQLAYVHPARRSVQLRVVDDGGGHDHAVAFDRSNRAWIWPDW
jgi:Tol biopolymer transport system component